MIVPQYWAEARVQHKTHAGRSPSDASAGRTKARPRPNHTPTVAQPKPRRVLAGEKLFRVDLKRAYNGAQGLPIREEILSRHGETIIMRNSYGARCLNTPTSSSPMSILPSRGSVSGLLSHF